VGWGGGWVGGWGERGGGRGGVSHPTCRGWGEGGEEDTAVGPERECAVVSHGLGRGAVGLRGTQNRRCDAAGIAHSLLAPAPSRSDTDDLSHPAHVGSEENEGMQATDDDDASACRYRWLTAGPPRVRLRECQRSIRSRLLRECQRSLTCSFCRPTTISNGCRRFETAKYKPFSQSLYSDAFPSNEGSYFSGFLLARGFNLASPKKTWASARHATRPYARPRC
jgi:hypothetical protein